MNDQRIRVYIPATVTTLRALRERRALGPSPEAHAVTPSLREWYMEGDQEELEYAAFTRAARSALRLLSDDQDALRRRVVISADVPASATRRVSDALGSSQIEVMAPIPLSDVAAFHVDGASAEADVAAAVSALDASLTGDPDARFMVDSTEDHELEWFDPSELETFEPST